MTERLDYLFIGGGFLGMSGAMAAAAAGAEVYLLEKSNLWKDRNQSNCAAGGVHSRVNYDAVTQPNKVECNVPEIVYEWAAKYNVAHERCKKLSVATSMQDVEALCEYYDNGRRNGVDGIRLLSRREVNELEPNLNAVLGVLVPDSGLIDTAGFLYSLYCNAEKAGVNFCFGNEVRDIKAYPDCLEVLVWCNGKEQVYEASTVINCAGLYAGDIARMVNPQTAHVAMHRRLEYVCTKKESELITGNMTIATPPYGLYANGLKADVSYAEFRRLCTQGVLTPTVGVKAKREVFFENGKKAISPYYVFGPASTTGVGKEEYMPGPGGKPLREVDYFVGHISHYLPGIRADQLKLHTTGIMTELKGNPDFVVERDPVCSRLINVLGVGSPGMTSCLKLGEKIAKLL